MPEQYQIEHQAGKQQFVISLAAEQARLQYSLDLEQRQVHFYSTYVPASARGKGVANQLVVAAMDWATEQNYRISTSCSYVQIFMDKKVHNPTLLK